MTKKRLAILAIAGGLSACALALGKHYTPYDKVPGGMSVVYIYSKDAGTLQNVFIDRKLNPGSASHRLDILPEGYFPFLGTGTIRILSGPKDNPTCVVQELYPNEAHWVRVSSNEPYVEWVPNEVAAPEIADKREISRDALVASPQPVSTENCAM